MAIDNYTPEQIEEILQAFFEVAGTRQYIGARYVPIFGRGRGTSVDWDGGADAYEPLSIVYYQGDTYTSRRYVPAGIAIDNQDYWVITGRYNAQVEQYRQEVLQFSGRIDGAYEAIENLREDVADEYIPFPDGTHYPKYGVANQVLSTLTNGQTEWVDPVIPDSDVVGTYVSAWLDDHPEATTTVQDNSLTTAKYQDGSITTAKLADNAVTDAKRDMAHPVYPTNSDLNDAPIGVVYLANYTYTNIPDELTGNPTGVLITYKYRGYQNKNQILICTVTGGIYSRFYYGSTGSWYSWVSTKTITKIAPSGTDLNSIDEGQYILYNHYQYTNLPDNSPHNGIFNCYKSNSDATIMQTFQDHDGGVYFRFFYNNSWRDWSTQYDMAEIPQNTDLNDLVVSGKRFISNSVANTISNMPSITGGNKTAVFEVAKNITTAGTCVQTIEYVFSGEKFYRYRRINNTWSSWAIYGEMTELASNTNLDNVTLTCKKLIPNNRASSIINMPSISLQNKTSLLEVYKDVDTDGVYIQTIEFIFTGEKFYRYHYINDTWSSWTSLTNKEISILFVGNSLQQDAVTYLPYILKKYFPEIKFKLYIWYIAGADCATQYSAFTNDTPAVIFSKCENDTVWTNYNNSVTMDDVLSTYTFDVVSLMEYFSNRTTFTISDIDDWVNCATYIATNYAGDNGLKFTSWFQTPRIQQGYDPDLIFDLNKQANDLFLQNTVCEDVISPGIAMYRARATTLNALGDGGGMTADGVHAQEGLPCLMEAYVVLMWILDKLGIAKSVYGFPLRMTTAIYNTLNVPGPNLGTGVIQGTDAQNLLAQEVAIKAYKEGLYYVLNGLFNVQP